MKTGPYIFVQDVLPKKIPKKGAHPVKVNEEEAPICKELLKKHGDDYESLEELIDWTRERARFLVGNGSSSVECGLARKGQLECEVWLVLNPKAAVGQRNRATSRHSGLLDPTNRAKSTLATKGIATRKWDMTLVRNKATKQTNKVRKHPCSSIFPGTKGGSRLTSGTLVPS